MTKVQVVKIDGGDYAALSFEDEFGGIESLKEYIKDNGLKGTIDNDDYYFDYEVKEYDITNIDDFALGMNLIEDIRDYDSTKDIGIYIM